MERSYMNPETRKRPLARKRRWLFAFLHFRIFKKTSGPLDRAYSIAFPLLVVVGLVVEDGEGAIELFGKEQADHLMGERHLRKRDHFIASFVHRRGEAVRPADDEDQTAGAGSHALYQRILCYLCLRHYL